MYRDVSSRTWAYECWVSQDQALVEVPQLQQRKNGQAKGENPRLPSPELIVAGDGEKQELYAAFREDEAHAGEYTGERRI